MDMVISNHQQFLKHLNSYFQYGTLSYILFFQSLIHMDTKNLMFCDKGSYATWGNFPSVEWILVNIIITTNCTDNILWLVDSWDFKLSIDHHLWTVQPVVKFLSMLKTKCCGFSNCGIAIFVIKHEKCRPFETYKYLLLYINENLGKTYLSVFPLFSSGLVRYATVFLYSSPLCFRYMKWP